MIQQVLRKTPAEMKTMVGQKGPQPQAARATRHPLVGMHGTVGNHGVLRRFPPMMQAKLRIGSVGDRYEREADQVAESILRMPPSGIQGQISRVGAREPLPNEALPSAVMRQKQAEEEEDANAIQTKQVGDNSRPTSARLGACVQACWSKGRPLSLAERSFFEPRLGHDLSQVSIHTSQRAAQAAQGIGAEAFTLGRHIAFAAGRYQLDSARGARLLAHELVHVVQQSRSTSKDSTIRRQKERWTWAYRPDEKIGEWHPAGKWTAVVPFHTFASLLASLKGQTGIKRLGIIAHGDIAGVVQIPIPQGTKARSKEALYQYMSPWTIRRFASQFKELRKHLAANADVVIYGCISGLGCEGDYLLKEISKALPGTRIVGFTVILTRKPGAIAIEKRPAGELYATGKTMRSYSRAEAKHFPRLEGTNSDYAKHAKNGNITKRPRKPKSEQGLRCEKWKPHEIKLKRLQVFDLLRRARKRDPELYYFGILLFGWWTDKTQSRSEGDFRRGWLELEKALKPYAEIGLPPVQVEPESGIQVIQRPELVKPTKLTGTQQKIYSRLKDIMRHTMGVRYANWVAWIWAQSLSISAIRKAIRGLLRKAGIGRPKSTK